MRRWCHWKCRRRNWMALTAHVWMVILHQPRVSSPLEQQKQVLLLQWQLEVLSWATRDLSLCTFGYFNVVWSSLWNFRHMQCRLPCGITRCHLPPDTGELVAPHWNTRQPGRPILDLPTPEGWEAKFTWLVGCTRRWFSCLQSSIEMVTAWMWPDWV